MNKSNLETTILEVKQGIREQEQGIRELLVKHSVKEGKNQTCPK
jgi:hypothetical protein